MIRSFPFNAVYDANGVPDRAYLAEDFARYFAKFIGTGVYPNPATGLQVVAIDNNMQIRIKKGDGYILGRDFENTDDYIIQLDVADGVLSRIDRVVLRLDYLKRDIIPVLKKGNYASSPIAPVLQRDADAYEIALADVYIKNGVIKINQSDITDTRLNKELCGIVHGVVNQVDTTEIFRQFQSWFSEQKTISENEFNDWLNKFKEINGQRFNEWIEDLKNSLDPNEDIAAQLQFQISNNKLDIADINTKLSSVDIKLENYNSYASGKDSSGVYTIIEYKDKTNTLYMKSVLSNPDSNGNYRTDTWSFYENGTVSKTIKWTLTYDAESNITSKVVA